MYSILTLLLLLNQNFPVEVIFSVSAVSTFSCVKELSIEDTLDDSAANCFLNAAISPIGRYPECWEYPATVIKTVNNRTMAHSFFISHTKLVPLRICFFIQQLVYT